MLSIGEPMTIQEYLVIITVCMPVLPKLLHSVADVIRAIKKQ